MEGTRMSEGLTPEELAEAERSFEVMKEAVQEDLWRIACLMAEQSRLIGFSLVARNLKCVTKCMRIGAKAVGDRRQRAGRN